jgi:hypothetical protein
MVLSFGSFYEKCVARFGDLRARNVERAQRARLAPIEISHAPPDDGTKTLLAVSISLPKV